EITEAHGLIAYEVSNHAVPGYESRHNLTYWNYGEYIGIGPGAHGRVVIDGKRVATKALRSPEKWKEAAADKGHGLEDEITLTEKEQQEEMLMMGLRLNSGIEIAKINSFINMNKLAKLKQEGFVTELDGLLKPTRKGILVLNSLVAELL